MFTYENRVGRLIEFRMATPIGTHEVQAFQTAVARIFTRRAGRLVCCSDVRGMNVLPPDIAQQLLGVMKISNGRIERNGFYVSEGAVWSLQAERLIREAGNPGRRTFRERGELERWLGDVLEAPERVRMAAFLSEELSPTL
jgi:hypothetical protein